jgi:hypothetical protein
MSVSELQAKPDLPVASESQSKIEKRLDQAIKVVRKAKELVWELKELAIALIILWVLIKHAGPLF